MSPIWPLFLCFMLCFVAIDLAVLLLLQLNRIYHPPLFIDDIAGLKIQYAVAITRTTQ